MLPLIRPLSNRLVTRIPTPLCRATFRSSTFRRFPRINDEQPSSPDSSYRSRFRLVEENRPPPSFREELLKDDPSYNTKTFFRTMEKPRILRQIIFVAGGIFLSLNFAASWTEVDTARWREALRATKSWNPFGSTVSSEEMRRARQFGLAKVLQNNVKSVQDFLEPLPKVISSFCVWTYAQIATSYLNATESGRLAWQIGAINGAVWLAWQIPRFHPIMMARFMHHPLSGRASTLLTSIFSHSSFIHLAFNTIALTSFGSAAGHYLAQRQAQNSVGMLESSPRYHLFAVFVSAGLFAGLVSHVVAARILFPRLIARLSSSASPIASTTTKRLLARPRPTNEILPSLGASGGIYALVTMTALAYKDAEVAPIFLPVAVPIQWGVGGMIALDALGIIRGWRMFDHWAHLGGAAFGALYYKYGPAIWDELRVEYEDEGEEEGK